MTPDVEGLVRKLKGVVALYVVTGLNYDVACEDGSVVFDREDFLAAHDALSSLSSQLEEVKRERDELKREINALLDEQVAATNEHDAAQWRAQSAEVALLSARAEAAGLREALEKIARRARSEPYEDAYASEAPDWAKDPLNGDDAAQCGYCGSWMTVVRPGKVQCDTCSDGQDLGAIARSALHPEGVGKP